MIEYVTHTMDKCFLMRFRKGLPPLWTQKDILRLLKHHSYEGVRKQSVVDSFEAAHESLADLITRW